MWSPHPSCSPRYVYEESQPYHQSICCQVKEALGDSQAVVIVAGKDSEPNLSLSSLLKDSGDMVDSCHPPSSEDLCVLPYSSGTTGVPKGVMLTHANLVANMAQLNHPALDLMKDGETTICVLPLFHIFAMNVTMSNMLLNGGKLVTLPSFDPGEFSKYVFIKYVN